MEVKITGAVYIKVDWSYATLSSSCLEESETDAAHGWRGETLSLVQSLNRVYLPNTDTFVASLSRSSLCLN